MGKIIGLTFPKTEPAEEFACSQCGKKYKTQEGLDKHIKEKHPDAGAFDPGQGRE